MEESSHKGELIIKTNFHIGKLSSRRTSISENFLKRELPKKRTFIKENFRKGELP